MEEVGELFVGIVAEHFFASLVVPFPSILERRFGQLFLLFGSTDTIGLQSA